jgi:hypothetical protein
MNDNPAPGARVRLIAALALLFLLIASVACNNKATASQPAETYAATPHAVALDILPLESMDGSPRWLASYTNDYRTTKIEIDFLKPAEGAAAASDSGHGKLLSQAGSDPIPLLDALQKALQAKRRPTYAQQTGELPFSYVATGENQSRSPDGSYRSNPPGNWITTKIFLANDQAEVYFNYNPVIHKAEFAMKDPRYGDRVLTELAKVL